MRYLTFSFSVLSAFILTAPILTSCSEAGELPTLKEDAPEQSDLVSCEAYISDVKSVLSQPMTRSSVEEYNQDRISLLVDISRQFLFDNGITPSDLDLQEEDPIIAVVALGLVETYQRSESLTLRTTVGGCVLEGLGVRSMFKGGAKKIAKKLAKVALKKAIPYVGWGIAALDFANCMME